MDHMERIVRNLYRNLAPLFPKDHGFMLEIAKAESNFGGHPATFRQGYHGGIWQVDEVGFLETKNLESHPGLEVWHNLVERQLGIIWAWVVWQDCRQPLIGFLAARLFLLAKPGAIPDTVEGRAEYWKLHYNTSAGAGTLEHYLNSTKSLSLQEH